MDDDDDATASLSAGFGRPESELEQDEHDGAVKRAVHRLPLDVRSVLCLRVYDGLAFKTIAEILKLTPAAARRRYSRAVKSLRKSLPSEGARLWKQPAGTEPTLSG